MHSLIALGLSFGIFALGACGDKKKAAEEETTEVSTCESNADCAQGEVCLAKECASAASGAIYTDPSNAVTPDKMLKHMDMVNESARKRADDIINGVE